MDLLRDGRDMNHPEFPLRYAWSSSGAMDRVRKYLIETIGGGRGSSSWEFITKHL